MSKFRNKKLKLTVNGKLPFLTLFPTLANLGVFGYDFETSEIKKIADFVRSVSKITTEGLRVFVSIVNSRESMCEVVENNTSLGLIISTKALTAVAGRMLESENYRATQYGRMQNAFDPIENSRSILKIIDIVRGVREMKVPVIECEIKYSEVAWKYYFSRSGYSTISSRIEPSMSNGCSPFLSKRYEKHSFFALCKGAFSSIREEGDRQLWASALEKWEMDLDYFKTKQMPKAFVEQELGLLNMEFTNG